MMTARAQSHATNARLLKSVLAQYRSTPNSPLEAEQVENTLILLRLANEEAEVMQWAIEDTGASATELQAAAIHFIEHQCLQRATDFYRILALNPWSTLEELKMHYRLLMRIFHPDRGLVNAQLAEQYSARINQAYSMLKVEMAKFAPSSAQMRPPKTLANPIALQRGNAQRLRHGLRIFFLQRLRLVSPATLLLLFALLAAGTVYVVVMPDLAKPNTLAVIRGQAPGGLGYEESIGVTERSFAGSEAENTAIRLSQLDTIEPDTDHAELKKSEAAHLEASYREASSLARAPAGMPTQPIVSALRAPQKRLQTADVSSQTTANPPSVLDQQGLPTVPTVKHSSVTKVIPNPTSSTRQATVSATATITVAPTSPDSPPSRLTLPSAVHGTVESARNGASSTVQPLASTLAPTASITHVAAKRGSEAVSEGSAISPADLRQLVFLFVDGYQRGDIETFARAFAQDVQSDEGNGLAALQAAYQEVFSRTAEREMILKNLHWEANNQAMVGDALYRVNIKPSPQTGVKSSTGKLRFDVRRTNQEAKITAFYYVVDRRD